MNLFPDYRKVLSSKRHLLVWLSLFSTLVSFSQVIPAALRKTDLQHEMIEKTNDYDSLVLFDEASFWSDNKTMAGFGFKHGDCYKLTLFFNEGTGLYVLTLGHLEANDVKVYVPLRAYITSVFNMLRALNTDSLNLRSRTNETIMISDMPEKIAVLIVPARNEFVYKDSYASEFYQQIAWTSDRKTLIDIFTRLKAHLR